MIEVIQNITALLESASVDEKIQTINSLKQVLHALSPFKNEPVDCVIWIKNDNVSANDYNPNTVAPPEMQLLHRSIAEDGYTQPIVSWERAGTYEVVDGFHRHRVGKEFDDVRARVGGYLPVVKINRDRQDKGDRIAATIRHNRARGKHQVEAMSDIVIELSRRNWSNEKIARELGMDADEVLRLCQITGLVDVFADAEFSQAWDAAIMEEEDLLQIDESDIEQLNEKPSDRIFHEWHKWECFPAGFYSDKPPVGMTVQECEIAYRDFLADIPKFESYLQRVIIEWKISCEHYLTNEKMNRIAWLGQASMCLATGVPSRFCGGYNLLTENQQHVADLKAFEYLNIFLKSQGRDQLDWESAQSKTTANIY